MNLNACRVVLRPRGPLEVFDLSVCLVRQHLGTWFRLVAVTALPLALVLGVASFATGGDPWLLLVPLAAAPFLQAPATVLAGRVLFADEVRVRDVLWDVGRRLPPLLGAILIRTLFAAFGCGFLSWLTGLPAAWMMETTLLEQSSLGKGRRRSFSLSLANVGVAVSAVVGAQALTAWFAVVAETVGQGVVGTVLQLGEPFGNALDGVVTPYLLAGLVVAQPFVALVRVLLYIDARTRLEGWDLQVELGAAASRAEAS